MILTDTHTHLYSKEFEPDRDEMIGRAVSNGVSRFFLPNVDRLSIAPMLEVSDKYPHIMFPMMGLHPCSVGKGFEKELAEIETWFGKRKFYGVGEIGIDLFHDLTYRDLQENAFLSQIKWAKKLKLPVIIHSRNAMDEILKIIEPQAGEHLKGIFHCFTGNETQARQVISMNFKLGIGGVVTFKNSGLAECLKNIDPIHLVLETDSPYLAPSPHRGKRNESAYIKLVAQKLSDIYSMSEEKIADITTSNSKEIFGV